MLPSPRFIVRADRSAEPLNANYRHTLSEINALIADRKLNVLIAEYLDANRRWRPLIDLLSPPDWTPDLTFRKKSPVTSIQKLKSVFVRIDAWCMRFVKAIAQITAGFGCLIVAIAIIVAIGEAIYNASSTSSAIISVLPSAVRSQDSDDGYKIGYADGLPYGIENKEAPTLIEFNALVEHRTHNRSSKSDKEQWSAGYRAGFESGFHEAKKKAF